MFNNTILFETQIEELDEIKEFNDGEKALTRFYCQSRLYNRRIECIFWKRAKNLKIGDKVKLNGFINKRGQFIVKDLLVF